MVLPRPCKPSVNRGLSEARGEYVAVVEPDDFIAPDMLADLYAAAFGEGVSRKRMKVRVDRDHPADIVKSSHWNYYDLEDGSDPCIEPSNLMNKMPDAPFSFTVHTHWEVLYHHPSIWSVIYRRAFLEERGIRMIEPEGAGWADNPFLFETLCQARSIVWMPGAYYHYRQANPHASSYLKDFHLPFDRLRDIRALLDRIGERDPHVLVCFYNRTFSYIKSVLEKFGFPENDPEVFGLIKEALAAMDPEVLYGAKRGIRRDQIEYYEDVMGVLAERVKPRAAAGSPRVSIVVSMKDVRPYVWGCLDSLAKQAHKSFEVICVDCASSDRTRNVASYFPGRDKRFSVIKAGEVSIPQGFAAGLARARGEVVYFADPRNVFGKLREFEGSQHDKEVARGIHCYIVEAMLADLSEMGDLEDERRYFELLKGTFGNMKSALNLPSAHFINAESYRKLQRLASMNYEQYLRRETVASRDKARVMSESTAYRIGTAIATFGPRLLPKGIAMRVRKMV